MLVRSNLRLVIWVARRYGWSALPLPDRIQEGNIGLLKAVDRFDVARGHRFATYAIWWIRQAVSRAVQDQGRIIRLPVHIGEAARRLERALEQLPSDRAPSAEGLAADLDLPVTTVSRLLAVLSTPESLDEAEATDPRSIASFLTDPAADGPEQAATIQDLRVQVSRALGALPVREERILRMRFGLALPSDQTLEEIGQTLDVTRERVRQIEAKALKRLEHPARSRKLRTFLEN
jgi:RNA polymerase primary sigma factor